METVIPPDKKSGHVIQKYRFKVLSQGVEESEESQEGGVRPYVFGELGDESETMRRERAREEDERPPEAEAPEEAAEEGEEEGGAAAEELLKRIDELSTELVKTQMLLEKREAEFAERLEATRAEGYDEGVEAGRSSCAEEVAREMEPLKARLAASIEALEESRQLFLKKVDSIEEELIETALDLAKQVVVKEIERDSKEVALRLARLLLTEVKEAAQVTLKVSPEDADYLRAHLGGESHLSIVADPAVAPGGVVVLSDIGNIDGEIMHRFERIKEAVFGTVK
ncbi:flagellar assembly protein FliH [Hydrogenimonas sp.]